MNINTNSCGLLTCLRIIPKKNTTYISIGKPRKYVLAACSDNYTYIRKAGEWSEKTKNMTSINYNMNWHHKSCLVSGAENYCILRVDPRLRIQIIIYCTSIQKQNLIDLCLKRLYQQMNNMQSNFMPPAFDVVWRRTNGLIFQSCKTCLASFSSWYRRIFTLHVWVIEGIFSRIFHH